MACMPSLSHSYPYSSIIIVLTIIMALCQQSTSRNLDTKEQRQQTTIANNGSNSTPALFVFGDSTVDSGNNNYIKTVFKSDFPPYGKDFPNHVPTGRFTNGRLVTDFIFSHSLGKGDYIRAYLDPSLSLADMVEGVCFASATSGLDPLTAQLNGVISMESQIEYFKVYKLKLEQAIGKERSTSLIRNGVYLISVGTNDFLFNFYGAVPLRRHTYTISNYQQFLIQLGMQSIQSLMEAGAKKIAFVGLPPMGCVPAIITLNSDDALSHRGCIESLSNQARDYNRILQKRIKSLQRQNPAAKIAYVDIYTPLEDIINNPQQYGFDRVNRGCCGSGLVEASFLCNPHTTVCSDDTKYVFWDSMHPTEAAYYKIFESVRPIVDFFLN